MTASESAEQTHHSNKERTNTNRSSKSVQKDKSDESKKRHSETGSN